MNREITVRGEEDVKDWEVGGVLTNIGGEPFYRILEIKDGRFRIATGKPTLEEARDESHVETIGPEWSTPGVDLSWVRGYIPPVKGIPLRTELERAHDDLCRVLGVLPTTTWVEIFAEIGKLQAYRDIHDKIMESEVEDDIWPG